MKGRTMALNTTGMATAISINEDDPPTSCRCEADPELAVQFITTKKEGIAVSARRQEIFLDYTGLLASQRNVCFILDERFDSFLEKQDREFKTAIQDMMEKSNRSTLAVQRLEALLREHMGYDALDHVTRKRLFSTNRPDPSEVGENMDTSDLFDSSQHRTTVGKHASHQPDHFPGHVFCVNGSVCDLACDAFLCPASVPKDEAKHFLAGRIFGHWRRKQTESYPQFMSNLLSKSSQGGRAMLKRYTDYPKAATFRDWPWEAFQKGKLPASLPFLVVGHVGYGSGSQHNNIPAESHVEQLVDTLRNVLTVSLMELQSHQPKAQNGRERFLVAVPVLGTGSGGAIDLTGQVIVRTLQVLNDFAVQNAVDIVLVCADAATYALAQQIRYQRWKRAPSFQSIVNGTLHKETKRLAEDPWATHTIGTRSQWQKPWRI